MWCKEMMVEWIQDVETNWVGNVEMLGILRMEIKGGSTQKQRTFFLE